MSQEQSGTHVSGPDTEWTGRRWRREGKRSLPETAEFGAIN
jgi:hypothetical protein